MKQTVPKHISLELSVGQVAERSGVAISTVHYYESEGLISGWRNQGNQRRYAREVLRRVAVIKVAQRSGISLASIRKAMAALPGGRTPTADDWQKLLAGWKADLNDRITRLTRLRDQLDGCMAAAASRSEFVRCAIPGTSCRNWVPVRSYLIPNVTKGHASAKTEIDPGQP